MKGIWAESIVSGSTYEPLVNIRMDDLPIGQFSPDDARQFARQLFEAAEAADSDAFIFKWLTRDILATSDENKQAFAEIIGQFRKFRLARPSTAGSTGE